MTTGRAPGSGVDGAAASRPDSGSTDRGGVRGPGGPSRFAVPVQQLEASARVPLAACVASLAEPPPAVPADLGAVLRWGDGAVADGDGD